jgi:Mrp family chromosome partitioning ATPase
MPPLACYANARRLIAVTSCKGGVGKSTVSANLAFRLAARGHRVGLYDADVQGPSLPTQFPEIEDTKITLGDRGWSVMPLSYQGVKLMSFGWFAASWGVVDGEVRGNPAPLATQLLHTTEWGELDYLIVDSPPGTGDIPRALATQVPLHGALVVTTPSRLAVVDVVRGVRMLTRLNVPILAVVENMSSFRCDGCEREHFPFGSGHLDEVLASIGGGPSAAASTASFRLPIVPADDGTDQAIVGAASNMTSHFEAIAMAVEAATAASDEPPAALPDRKKLPYHEMPHWPTIIATGELFR